MLKWIPDQIFEGLISYVNVSKQPIEGSNKPRSSLLKVSSDKDALYVVSATKPSHRLVEW